MIKKKTRKINIDEEEYKMPHIAITMIPGRDRETKKELALKVQTFICRELNLEPEFVSVSIEDVPKEDWAEHMKNFSEDIIYTDHH